MNRLYPFVILAALLAWRCSSPKTDVEKLMAQHVNDPGQYEFVSLDTLYTYSVSDTLRGLAMKCRDKRLMAAAMIDGMQKKDPVKYQSEIRQHQADRQHFDSLSRYYDKALMDINNIRQVAYRFYRHKFRATNALGAKVLDVVYIQETGPGKAFRIIGTDEQTFSDYMKAQGFGSNVKYVRAEL